MFVCGDVLNTPLLDVVTLLQEFQCAFIVLTMQSYGDFFNYAIPN